LELDGNPHSQAMLREDDALLNSIRFDICAWAKNDKLYTADIQRSYKEARLERRTVYYACRSIYEADKYANEFEKTDLGKELIVMYNNTAANANHLARVENSPYFIERLTEAQLEEERKKAERKALIKTARKMLSEGFTLDIIIKCIDLDIDTLQSLKPV